MRRTCSIALFSAMLVGIACKKADPPAGAKPEPVTKAADPSKPADPATRAEGAAKPVDTTRPATASTAAELEAKGAVMMQQMGELFVADAHDCEKLAADLKAFAVQNKGLLGQLTLMGKMQTAEEKAALEGRNRLRQEELMKKVNPTMAECGDNENVEAAMKQLAGG